jgi:hypothetical protein
MSCHYGAGAMPCDRAAICANTPREYGYGGGGPSGADGGLPDGGPATPMIRIQLPRRRAAGLLTCTSGDVNPPGIAQRPCEAQAGTWAPKPTISIGYSGKRRVLMAGTGPPEYCPPARSLDTRSRFPFVSGQGLPQAITGLTKPTTGTVWQNIVVSTSARLRGRKS